jgi:periplasmic divalent cation tolerance protein
VTAPIDAAPELARELVRRRVAACANVVPTVQSYFWWDDQVQDEPESLLVLKTRSDAFERLRDAVVELHPYDVPEVIATQVEQALEPYARWVAEEVESPP